jgi:hypothetical protein
VTWTGRAVRIPTEAKDGRVTRRQQTDVPAHVSVADLTDAGHESGRLRRAVSLDDNNECKARRGVMLAPGAATRAAMDPPGAVRDIIAPAAPGRG